MNTKENIDKLVEATLESVATIQTVKTPPFFKDKLLRSLSQSNVVETEDLGYFDWFTPKYQAAALICFVFLNAFALLNYSSESYGDNVISFAEVYGLSESESDTYLYQN